MSAKLSALILIGLTKLLFGLHDLFCCGITLICSRHLENPRPLLFALNYNVAAVGHVMLSVFLPIQQNRPIQPSIHLGRILFLTGLSCWRFSIILFIPIILRSFQSRRNSGGQRLLKLCTEFCLIQELDLVLLTTSTTSFHVGF